MVYLDGQLVEVATIDPAKHKFVGTFRSPGPPNGAGYVMCDCGTVLQITQAVFDHWRMGHMDTPQYMTLAARIA